MGIMRVSEHKKEFERLFDRAIPAIRSTTGMLAFHWIRTEAMPEPPTGLLGAMFSPALLTAVLPGCSSRLSALGFCGQQTVFGTVKSCRQASVGVQILR
jgi:hypothetical protein